MKQQTVFPSLLAKCLKAMLVFGCTFNYAIAQPAISSLSTLSGIPGASVTITGSGFNDTAANDIVFFGAAQATVTAASSTSLTVTIPTGAIYRPVSVLNTTTGLTGYATSSFLPTYNNAGYVAGTVNFDSRIDSTTYGNFPNAVALSDIDGDGKIDVIGPNFSSGNIYIYRNASTSGTIAFDAIDTMTSGSNAFRLSVADIDGDGKPDIVVPNRASNTLTLYRNTSTAGSISFASTVTLSAASQPNSVAIGDIDGDGKPDMVVANQSGRSISVFRNTGTPGSFSFASRIDYSLPSYGYQVAIGDIDGDGKPDIAISEGTGADSVCLFRNTSTPGTISLAARQDFTTPSDPLFVGFNDLDGDGKADMVTVNLEANNFSVFMNTSTTGAISFASRSDFSAGHATGAYSIGDVDGDGKPDICLANGLAGNVSVYLNTSSSGTINFASTVNFPNSGDVAYIAVGDIDGDGKPDMAVANQGTNKVSFYRNNPLQPIVGATSVCVGSTITLSDVTSGGTWKSSNASVATVSAGVVTGVAAGTATITYSGTAGRSYTGNTVTQAITVNALPSVSAGSNVAICTGSSATLTATGAITYTWSPSTALSATTGASITASPTTGTTYTVTGTDINGCVNSAAKTVSVNALPTISAGANVAICSGSSTSMTASGGTAYSWSPSTGLSATTGTSVSASPASTTTYTVTGTNTNGCVNTATKTVTVNALPAISAGANVAICTGSSTAISASGGATYTWSPSTALSATTGASITATPTSTITYTVTGKDANNCQNKATQTVTVNALPSVSAGSNVAICTGSSATLTATGAVTYTWSPSTALSATTGASITASPTTGTTYTVTGTDINGCVKTAAKTVSVNALPTISAGANVAICSGSSASMTASGGSSYSWLPSTGLSATTGTSVSASPASTTTYTVTGTNTNGCVNTATKTVTVNALPVISAGANVAICSGSSSAVTALGGATYTWLPSTGLAATTGSNISASPTATTVYTVTGTDLNGCKNKATQTVTVNALPAAVSVSGGGVFCNSATINATGGAGGTIYFEGTTSGGTSIALASASHVITSSGTYYFRAQSSAGCWGTQGSAAVTINPLPSTYSVTGGGAVCSGTAGATIGLSGTSAGISYKLLRGTTIVSTITGTGSSMNFTPQSIAGTYTAVATNTATGCAANMAGSATVLTGTYPTPAIVSVTGGGGYCSGGTGVNIGVAGSAVGISYQLYRGTTAIGGPMAGIGAALSFGLQTVAGTYTVVATNPSSGCSHSMSGSTTVYVYPVPAAYTVTGGGSICAGSAGVHVGLGGSASGVRYKLFRDRTPTGSIITGTGAPLDFGAFTTAGTYTITGTNSAYGCVSTMDTDAVIAVSPVPVITGPSYSLPVGATVTMLATPAEGVWTSSTPAVATIDSLTGLVTGISGGSDLIRYTLSSGCSASYIIKVILSAHRGEEEHAAMQAGNEGISLAPNPNNGVFTIKGILNAIEDQEVAILITNMAGQVVYTNRITANGGVINATIQLTGKLAGGLYQLALRSTNESRVLPVVIQQ